MKTRVVLAMSNILRRTGIRPNRLIVSYHLASYLKFEYPDYQPGLSAGKPATYLGLPIAVDGSFDTEEFRVAVDFKEE